MRILWVKTELLHPVDKGGKIRTYHMLKELKRDHHITYLTLDNGCADSNACELAKEYCNELVIVAHKEREKFSVGFYAELAMNLVSRLPYAIKKYESPAMWREISDRTRGAVFDVLVCDFLAPAVNVPRDVSCPTVLFQHNVEAMIWRRHYQVQMNPVKRIYLYSQWRKMLAFERGACRRFDCVVAVSREDREVMQQYGANNVHDIPTGVDTDFFRPNKCKSLQRNNLVFTGSMDWLPNEDAISYFIDEIFPLIRQSIPDITLTVVGRSPYPSLLARSKKEPSIVVTGRVEDVRPYIDAAAAYVVPLRIGGGTRLKIYEAMAMGKPVISTSVGAEGLPVHNGKDLLLADSPQEFAAAVIRTLLDERFAAELGNQAGRLVRDNFGWNNVAKSFVAICEPLLTVEHPPSSLLPLCAESAQP
jgi:sugar transferase (PEP-CTERM/EpsH1 system associated)